MSRAARLLGAHWYVPAFAAMLLGIWLLARTPAFMAEGGEAALLIDLCITAPVLYVLCYGRRQPIRTTAVRALAIACSGLWIASWLIPVAEQSLLPQFAPFRWAGIAFIVLVELWIVVAVTRIAWSGKGTAEQISAKGDVPAWMARALLWEANFWRAVWRFMRGRRP